MPGGVGGEGPGSPVLPYPDFGSWGRKWGYGTPSGTPKTRVAWGELRGCEGNSEYLDASSAHDDGVPTRKVGEKLLDSFHAPAYRAFRTRRRLSPSIRGSRWPSITTLV